MNDWLKIILYSLVTGLVLFAIMVVVVVGGFEVLNAGKIYPGVQIGGVDVGGLTLAEAAQKIAPVVTYSQTGRITFQDGGKTWVATPGQLGYLMFPEATVQNAYSIGRRSDVFTQMSEQMQCLLQGVNLPPVVIYDQRIAQRFLQDLAREVDRPVVEASLGLNGVEVLVRSGQVGRTLDVNTTLSLLNVQIATLHDATVPLVVNETQPVILDATAQAEKARQILSAPLTLQLSDGQTDAGPWVFEPASLTQMLSIEQVKGADNKAHYEVVVNSENLRSFLSELAGSLSRQAKGARYVFNDEKKELEVIQEAVIGRELDVEATIQAVNQRLGAGEHTIPLVLNLDIPAASNTTKAADLGISELVAEETTYFYGSSAARLQNIRTASSQFHGVLVAPGETFSMASVLGDVTLDNGYAEALIIVGNQSVKGVGGGVCQVSTTLFRTAFMGGFPIVERHAHAYRVSYYEQRSNGAVDSNLAGLDATVFVPLVDFKFTNDTPYWLLMETYMDGYSLTWKFYSTSDHRTVEWHTTGLRDITEPPKPLYQENPALSKGEIKQVDWEVAGANITVTRIVYRGNDVYLQDSFSTHYQAWRSIFQYGPGTEGIPKENGEGEEGEATPTPAPDERRRR
ncbi:MAG TPA: VanW family protein [Anaerolineaceae bacterium]|nr:VanW family protein [Anaerolineaceae bacterium]HPN51571.1 VanW family protein [Anaerolineaceae bacterium]